MLPFLCQFDSPVFDAKAQRDIWCWSKVDMEKLREGIRSADWSKVLESTNVDTAWTVWKTQLLDIAQRFIPKRQVAFDAPRPRPWINAEVRDAIQSKHRLFRHYKKTTNFAQLAILQTTA